jgi:hypothetical protein
VFAIKEPQGVDFEGLWSYYKFFKLKHQLLTVPVNEKIDDAVTDYDTYVNKIKTKFGITSVQYLIAKLYEEAPLRNNFTKMKIVEHDEPVPNDENSIQLPENRINGSANIHLKKYKTQSKYGEKIIQLSRSTTRLLLLFIVSNKLTDFLFKKDISRTISDMNKSIDVSGSVNTIRHMIVSTLYWKKDSLDIDELAHKIMDQTYIMGHEISTWFGYVRALKK